jgi:hypothetical protein
MIHTIVSTDQKSATYYGNQNLGPTLVPTSYNIHNFCTIRIQGITILWLLVFNENAFWHRYQGWEQPTINQHMAGALVLRCTKSPSCFLVVYLDMILTILAWILTFILIIVILNLTCTLFWQATCSFFTSNYSPSQNIRESSTNLM